MRYINSFLIILLTVLVSCTPKLAKETTSTANTGGDFRATAPKAGAARAVEIGSSTTFTLTNGLKVVVVENHKLPQISYQLSIDRDPVLEKEKAGLADMAGSLLATGTSTKSKAEIDEAVDYIGANLSTNGTGGFASSLTKHTDKILSLFSEVILKPSFPMSEFDKIKNQTLSGLQTQKDDPNAISGNVSNALIFGAGHPYGEITNEITVANISHQDAVDFYHANFKPGSAYLVIVGDITPEAAKAKAEKYFGGWTAGKVTPQVYATPKPIDKTSVAFVDKAGAVQSVINVTYAVDLKPGSTDEIAARVMNTILGSGFSGRLFKNLREDKAYTYGAYSALNTDELVGSFSANASVRNEVTDSAIVQFLYELNEIRTKPVSKTELDLAKSFIAGAFARSLENPQTVANFALNKMMYNLPDDYYETYLQRLAAITVDDVTRVAKKYVTPDKARIVVVGNKDDVMPKLVAFDTEDGKIQLYDIYANPRKDESNMANDVDPLKVVDAYLTAIGGREKLNAVKGLDQTYGIEMQGMTLTARMVQTGGKFLMTMTAPGMNIMKQVFDGEKGVQEQMGQASPIEGEELAGIREQAILFPERMYSSSGYSVEVKGVEDVNGKSCYKIAVTKPSGSKSIEYYDRETHLKVKEIQSVSDSGETTNTVYEFSDYKNVDGIMVPHTITVSGAMPMPLVMKASTIKVNSAIDPALFKI